MATCNTTTLLANGKCFTCLGTKHQRIAQLQLLCELKEAIEALSGGALPIVADLVYAASIDVDFDGADYYTILLGGDIDFNASVNRPTTGYAKAVAIVITCDGSDRAFTFNANWTCVGAAPTGIAASKTGVLSITALGPDETDVIYTYQEEA